MKTKFLRKVAVCTALMSGVCAGAHASALGLHMGSDGEIAQYEDFSKWLGKPVMYRLVFVNGSSWNDIADPFFLASATKAWLRSNASRVEILSVPMLPNSGNHYQLRNIADGNYDTYYKRLAENIASKTGAPQRVIVRLGWELNGKWYPWSAVDSPSEYKAAYRHIVRVMRSKCAVLRFEWNVNWGGTFDWTKAYPGDDVVDVMGMDVYDQYNKGWDDVLNTYEGLSFFRSFARRHGKSEAYSEWGVSTKPAPVGHGDDTAYIRHMYDWIKAGDGRVLYANYWNVPEPDSPGPNGVIYSNSRSVHVTVPKSAALYKKLFGQ